MTDAPDDIRDDPEFFFLMCAAVAWAEVSAETGQWPPDSEATRRRAYDLYEQAVREKDAAKAQAAHRPPQPPDAAG